MGVLGGTSTLVMSICSFLYIFIVHYVSWFSYSYDYYSSSYSGIFWPVISLISDSDSFPHRVSSKLGSGWSGSPTTLDASTPDVPKPSPSSSSTSATFQVGMLFKYFDQWRSITSNRFVLNMVQGHHLQLRSRPPLFCDFWHFNVKAATAHRRTLLWGCWFLF